jgi:hypothetical protein
VVISIRTPNESNELLIMREEEILGIIKRASATAGSGGGKKCGK